MPRCDHSHQVVFSEAIGGVGMSSMGVDRLLSLQDLLEALVASSVGVATSMTSAGAIPKLSSMKRVKGEKTRGWFGWPTPPHLI